MNEPIAPSQDYNKKRPKRLGPSDRDYVSNKDLFIALVEHINIVNEAKAKDPEAHVQPSQYIIDAIMLICQRRLNAFNFAKYEYKDEMLASAYMDCFKDVCLFDPERSQNPFSYFTTIANNAYRRIIKLEKAYLYTKYCVIDDMIRSDENDENIIKQYGSDYTEEQKNEYMAKFEQAQRDAKERSKQKQLEKELNSKKSLI